MRDIKACHVNMHIFWCHVLHILCITRGDFFELHTASKVVSAPLVERVFQHNSQLTDCHAVQQNRLHSNKHAKRRKEANNLQRQFPAPLQDCMELSQEKGALTWLTALPIDSRGFALHKSAFRDTFPLRYNWGSMNSPSQCSCGHVFSVEHGLSCPTGGFPTIRHMKDHVSPFSHHRSLQGCIELSQEKGALTWLTALSIDSHGFALQKSGVSDAFPLCYTDDLSI